MNKEIRTTESMQDDWKRVLEIRSRGPWLATATGGGWSLFEPSPEDVRFEDICAGLARTCRWAGQIRLDVDFFSTAEHSTEMTRYAIRNNIAKTREDALAILFHDGSEAPLVDMMTPAKRELPGWEKFEGPAQKAVDLAFDLTPDTVTIPKAVIKEIDTRIRIDERLRLIAQPARSIQMGALDVWEDAPDAEPLGLDLRCLNPREAMTDFAECFIEVMENLPRTGSGRDLAAEQAERCISVFLPDHGPLKLPSLHSIDLDF